MESSMPMDVFNSRKRCLPKACACRDIKNCKYRKLGKNSNRSEAKDIAGAHDGGIVSRDSNTCGETAIEILPTTVMLTIFKYLSLHDLLSRASLVCKQWNELSRDPELWRVIDLKWQTKVDDNVLKRLCSYSSNVTSLCAPNLKMVTGRGVRAILQQCTNLRDLTVAGSMDLECTAFDAIGEYCHNLVAVDLSCCFTLNNSAVAKMAEGCPLLEHVSLSQCYMVSDEGVKAVAQGCPRLKILELKHNIKVTDGAIKAICNSCGEIEQLLLTRCDVTSACLQHIAKLPALKVLELASIGPVKAAEIYEVVKNCTVLSRLNLSLCQSVDDSCVDVIVKYATRLSSLYLVSCSITDKSLNNLAKSCKTLERLDIGWCQAVTDSGVSALCRKCPNLKYLGLMRCDAVTNRNALELSNTYPHCTISTVWLDCFRLLEKADCFRLLEEADRSQDPTQGKETSS